MKGERNEKAPLGVTSNSRHLTTDTFLNGRLTVYQNKNGYRFSIDSILLAGYVRPKANGLLVDMGCGCGIITLILAHRYPALHLYGVEIQPGLAELARQNAAINGMRERITILEMDINTVTQKQSQGPVDIIVCNPPFGLIRSGRINPNRERALARHEIAMSLKDITAAAHRSLRTGGQFFIIYPVGRMVDLFCRMRADGIEPKRMRTVKSTETDLPKRVLVEGVAGGRPGISMEPPLVIYQANGGYTLEVQRLMA